VQKVEDVVKRIPLGFPTKLQEILAPWTDFFVPMLNGLVGTAMGYETGMIRENGTLDPAFASTFTTVEEVKKEEGLPAPSSNKPLLEKTADELLAQIEPIVKPDAPIVTPGNEKVELNAAAHELWQSSLDPDDENTLFKCFRRVQQIRAAIKGEPINPGNVPGITGSGTKLCKLKTEPETTTASCALNLSNNERESRRMEILQRVLDKLRRAPDHTLLLNVIMMDRQIRDLKKGAVSKMLHWLDEFKSTFKCTPIDGTPKFLVRLLDPNASAQTIMDSLPAAKRAKMI